MDEKSAFILQDSRGFREDEGQVSDMFQNKVTDNKIKFSVIARPLFRNISDGEYDVLCRYFLPGFLDHSLGKIERVDTVSNLGEKRTVLPRSASDLKDRVEMQIGKCLSGHLLVEIPCEIIICIVGIRPFVIGFLNIHFTFIQTEKILIRLTSLEACF